MKLHERLRLPPHYWDYSAKLKSLEIYRTPQANASGYDLAWDRYHLAHCRHLLALAGYFAEEPALAREHATRCLEETEEFLFGDWRGTTETPEKTIDAGWWKRRFVWMQLFEAGLLWASVLGRWDYLERLGRFPESDGCISDGYQAAERDLYVVWAAFLRGAATSEIEPWLAPVRSGRGRAAKRVLALLRAALARDAEALQKALIAWLGYYREAEFPKDKMMKKITFEGTYFVHWAEREGMPVVVPAEFADHIVVFP